MIISIKESHLKLETFVKFDVFECQFVTFEQFVKYISLQTAYLYYQLSMVIANNDNSARDI